MTFLRRWAAKVKPKVRSSLKSIKVSEVKAQGWLKQDRRACLDNTYYISQHYALLREMLQPSTLQSATTLQSPSPNAKTYPTAYLTTRTL
ncbi:hypothetical protein E4U19_000137 [Claviceps sp. Clav32 group G5]|nr:hypothetical protein E4U19_000137 [Claviceps sp. Clav32 group G5]